MAAYAALVSLSHILHQILNPPPLNKIIIDRGQIEFLHSKVNFLIDFLETYSSRRSREIANLGTQIADVAYEAEDIIESNVVKQIQATGGENIYTLLCEGVQTVIENFLSIEKELMKVRDMQGAVDLKAKSSSTATSSTSLPSGNNTMVGFDEHVIQVMGALATDESNRLVIPIVGMGGIGKTTLAKNVYDHPYVRECFYIRAWVTISQEYSVREILLELLHQVNNRISNLQEISDDKLQELVHKELFGNKYMIVMDDMWDIQAWDSVKRFLPSNNNGSRILATTRLSNLAVDFRSCSPYQIGLLDEEKSWDLLRGKVFGKEDCPIELEEIGKNIAKKCRGLPLALVVIGGLLAKSERTKEHWRSVEGDVSLAMNYGNDEHSMKIIVMSYSHLPLHLKPCFLYLAMFPEDSEIRVSIVVRLWVAEGFIKPTQAKCFEEVAHEYLEDFISRNLLLVHKRADSGKVKSCKIHDLVRDMCIIEAEKEKFLYIAKLDNPNISPNTGIKRRLSISSVSKPVEIAAIEALRSANSIRSWVSHGELSAGEPSKEWTVDQIIHGFELLKVAHVNDGETDIDILKFSSLRYVSTWSVSSISSISQCWNLQTIVVGANIALPTEIWQMPQLRHLKMGFSILPDPPNDQNVIVLENLQTLQIVTDLKFTEQVLRRIPNLKKLQIECGMRSPVASGGNFCLKNLVCFRKLESLTVYHVEISFTDIAFPISLTKLTIMECKIHWEDMYIVGWLPNLEVLNLHFNDAEGEEWKPNEGEFPRLKFLFILVCKLKIWQAENNTFPCLEHLYLMNLEIEEIPMSFAEISTLRVIELRGVPKSIRTSVREISEERELLGYEPLQVLYDDR